MEFITSPDNYNICFNIASLLVLAVVAIIHAMEEAHNNKQKQIFGMIVCDAIIVSLCGFVYHIWLYTDFLKGSIPASMAGYLVLCEKMCSYILGYLSMIYVMTIFRIEYDSIWKRLPLVLPLVMFIGFFISGLITDYFFSFDEIGNIVYNYPHGAIVNFGLFAYFIYAGYLYFKYGRSLSSEKLTALIMYYLLMLAGIPVRILTKSSSIFEFGISLALLLCVYTFQNPGEFTDRTSGASTKTALQFAVSSNILQKRLFTVYGIAIERLDVLVGGESLEAVSELLTQITAYLKRVAPEQEVFYVDDGNYLMVFPEAEPDDPVVEKVTEQIRKRFKEPWSMNGKEIKLVQSPYAIGFPDEIDTIEKFNEVREVIKKTLIHHNRDILRVADLNLKHVEHDKKIDAIVRHALDDDLLEVYYQPIYAPKEGKFLSCEALLRLKSPQMGFISPAVFMPVAERNGMVIAIDSYVLSSVCEMIATSEAVNLGLKYVEVNLSVVDCIQTNLAENVIKTLEKHSIRPDQINLEITETFEEGLTSIMDENIQKLSEYGISFSMDDFGTGYSNLSRIASLPVEIFKLDKSIVQSAFESETSYMVMLNLVKIIKSLGKEIVAEGVETQEQADQISRIGIDHIQGFFYGRAMPKDQFIEFLKRHNS